MIPNLSQQYFTHKTQCIKNNVTFNFTEREFIKHITEDLKLYKHLYNRKYVTVKFNRINGNQPFEKGNINIDIVEPDPYIYKRYIDLRKRRKKEGIKCKLYPYEEFEYHIVHILKFYELADTERGGDTSKIDILRIDDSLPFQIGNLFLNVRYKEDSDEERILGILRGMVIRCYDKNAISYERYGGRGITVCKEWNDDTNNETKFNSKMNFIKWSRDNGYKNGFTIERIDNNKGYSPDNCTWISHRQQCYNTRSVLNRKLPHNIYIYRNKFYFEISNDYKKYTSKTSISIKKIAMLRNKYVIDNNIDAPLIDIDVIKYDISDILDESAINYFDNTICVSNIKLIEHDDGWMINIDFNKIPRIYGPKNSRYMDIQFGNNIRLWTSIKNINDYNKIITDFCTNRGVPHDKYKHYMLPNSLIKIYSNYF